MKVALISFFYFNIFILFISRFASCLNALQPLFFTLQHSLSYLIA